MERHLGVVGLQTVFWFPNMPTSWMACPRGTVWIQSTGTRYSQRIGRKWRLALAEQRRLSADDAAAEAGKEVAFAEEFFGAAVVEDDAGVYFASDLQRYFSA